MGRVGLVVVAAATWMSAGVARAQAPAPLTFSWAPIATVSKNPNPPGCLDGIHGTVYTFEGKLATSFSPATVDFPKPEYFLYLRLKHPISVCSYHFADTNMPAYTNVKAILLGIYYASDYRAIMRRWGNRTFLMTGSLWNVAFSGHGGGPIDFLHTKRFCYNGGSKNTESVFYCGPWTKGLIESVRAWQTEKVLPPETSPP